MFAQRNNVLLPFPRQKITGEFIVLYILISRILARRQHVSTYRAEKWEEFP
jgi:hypothetical protein